MTIRSRATAVGLVLLAVAGAVAGIWLLQWWSQRSPGDWTVQVTNERVSDTLVAGIRGPMNEGTGYTLVDPNSAALAHVSHDAAPPDFVVFDLDSHKGPNGELVVVPVWQATHKAISCPWDWVQQHQPLVVTDQATTCADLTAH
jgi:hypothetical protein